MIKLIHTVSWVAAIAVASSLAVVMPAFAQTSASVSVGTQAGVWAGMHGGMRGGMQFGIVGTVSAINGETLTVTSVPHMRPMPEGQATTTSVTPSQTPTVYTVDATNAKIYKGSVTSTVSIASIATGDTVFVQGPVTGTNVAATVIRDGVPVPMGGPRGGMPGRGFGGHGASSTPSGTLPIQGNGEPVIGGNVTAINGTTLTVTNASNVTYTIDAANTTVVRNGTTTALSSVAVGDSVIVQGTVNGTSVTASSIIDHQANASSASQGKGLGGGITAGIGGFFGSIGGFFQHLFGF